MAKSTKLENRIRAVYVTLGIALVGGGAAWGTLKSEAGEAARAADKNTLQIERLTNKLGDVNETLAIINERTKRLESEQREIRGDIKLLLQRQITKQDKDLR